MVRKIEREGGSNHTCNKLSLSQFCFIHRITTVVLDFLFYDEEDGQIKVWCAGGFYVLRNVLYLVVVCPLLKEKVAMYSSCMVFCDGFSGMGSIFCTYS